MGMKDDSFMLFTLVHLYLCRLHMQLIFEIKGQCQARQAEDALHKINCSNSRRAGRTGQISTLLATQQLALFPSETISCRQWAEFGSN